MTASTEAGAIDIAGFWQRLAAEVQAWFAAEGVAVRDAIVLLPFAQLLAPARAAFAQAGGWQPRIETTHTLLASLGPARPTTGPGQDPAADRLAGAALLRGLPWGADWHRRDARAFDKGVAAMVSTAQALERAAQAHAPALRDDWWALARAQNTLVSGPGATERALARVALDWAAGADMRPGDALFALCPSAWVCVQAGGADPMAQALLAAATVPVRVIDTDSGVGDVPPPALYIADHLEQEAQGAATLVLRALNDGRSPVALVAQDRLVVRRVRALLERRGVQLNDETGWKLSTTRSAARVMATLRAAPAQAGADALLDWLKGEPTFDARRVRALERHWRAAEPLPEELDGWWRQARATLAPLQRARAPLDGWLAALAAVLPLDDIGADDAGHQLLEALRLDGRGWGAAGQSLALDLPRFTAWVDDTLELHTYLPAAQALAQVVITPLARAMLRPFGAVVCPGTDEQRLGAAPAPHPLLADALLGALGLPDARSRRRAEQLAFAQLLRLPNVMLLRRRSDGGEPLARSPLVEQAFAGRALVEVPVRLDVRTVLLAPLTRPEPQAPVPDRFSASTLEALRECPYRFFARAVLRLREADELDAEIEKRDYGNWLHAVLLRFHATRDARTPLADDLAALHAAADAVASESGLDAAQLLPYRAAFGSLAPRYVTWQRVRDAAGLHYREGEKDVQRPLPAAPGVVLQGRIDRIDEGPSGVTLIDYKTSSKASLRLRVRDPLEDTQLAFYAALLDAPQGMQAQYLALDARDAPSDVVHPDVAESAVALLAGVAADLADLRAGTGLAALGEEPVCSRCEARGLCRRDHWSTP